MEKLSRSRRLTVVLAGLLVGVIAALAGLVLVFPDSGPTESGTDMEGTAAVVPESPGAGGAVGTTVQGGAAVAPDTDQGNTFCRAYVYKRCNELNIGPTDCRGIVETGVDVPPPLGLAGCRAVVDDILARVAGLPEERVQEAPALGSVAVGPEGGDVENGDYEGHPTGRPLDEQDTPAVAAEAASGPSPAAVEKAMARLRQLQTEIAFARNNYVGTNIGVQSRLDEMRAIAEEIGTPEAMSAYNGMLARLGRAGGQPGPSAGAPVPNPSGAPIPSPTGTEVRVSQPVSSGVAVESSAVMAAPASAGQAQPVSGNAAPAQVVEVGASSF